MPAAKCSDQRFIELMRRFGSVGAVAKELGVHESNAHRRRKAIELRHHIKLHTIDHRPTYDQSALVTADRVEVKLDIKDGVVLVGSDAHYWPGVESTMHRAFAKLAGELKPKAIVMNGDAFDGATNSRWASIGWESKPDLKDELEACQDRLHELAASAPKGAKKIWTAGNHDLRFETYLAQHAPQYRGIQGIHLKDHFPEWIPAWFLTINGNTDGWTEIRHREKGGIHASYRNVIESGVNILTGHDHRADVVPYNDRRGRRYGIRAGMMANSSRDPQFVNYLEGRTANWQSALAVLTYKSGVLMYPELVLGWDEDHVQFRGQIIKV